MNLQIACHQLFLENRRHKGDFQYTVPSPTTYPHQWLWDSCFHAIILSHSNTEDAKKEILSLLSKQFTNGLIPHMIFWNPNNQKNSKFWGQNGTSSITQPPIVAYAVWEIFKKDKDIKFLEKIYPNLYHFYRYLLNERDPHDKHLIGILNPDESGEDDSPRFDALLGLKSKHSFKTNLNKRFELVKKNIDCKFDAPFCMRNLFWVKDVPFNSIMAENLKILADIAKKLDFDDDANYFVKQSEHIIWAMRDLMLEDGLFWSTYGEDYKKIKIKTWAIFTPLFANILTHKEAEILVEKHLLNSKEFWTKYPIPTVSLKERSFSDFFWRGPTWIGANWFIYKGLLNYGFTDVAKDIKNSSIRLIEKSGFREYFNCQTGEGLGAKNFTWGGLVVDMN
ncbi:MAG: trehalase family glycosidase [Candidatus Daviesbacteria bacterium]|nr:trehalase family glycosidase [Candidatus Daviesbacteria bacterium]